MKTYSILPNVSLGQDADIGQFVIIGYPPRGYEPGELGTQIGEKPIIRSHSVIYAGNIIGDDFQTGHHVLVREENRIGNSVSIGSNSVIEHHVNIGNDVRIHSNCFIPEYSVLEDDCWIGPGVVLTNAKYPLSEGVKERLKGPVIGSGAIIGAAAVILPGLTIGEDALVGAGSVVLENVPEHAVVAGNPARQIKDLTEIEVYRMRLNEHQAEKET